jgi:hypothetical protein
MERHKGKSRVGYDHIRGVGQFVIQFLWLLWEKIDMMEHWARIL